MQLEHLTIADPYTVRNCCRVQVCNVKASDMRQPCKLVVAWAALLLVCALGAAAGAWLVFAVVGYT